MDIETKIKCLKIKPSYLQITEINSLLIKQYGNNILKNMDNYTNIFDFYDNLSYEIKNISNDNDIILDKQYEDENFDLKTALSKLKGTITNNLYNIIEHEVLKNGLFDYDLENLKTKNEVIDNYDNTENEDDVDITTIDGAIDENDTIKNEEDEDIDDIEGEDIDDIEDIEGEEEELGDEEDVEDCELKNGKKTKIVKKLKKEERKEEEEEDIESFGEDSDVLSYVSDNSEFSD